MHKLLTVILISSCALAQSQFPKQPTLSLPDYAQIQEQHRVHQFDRSFTLTTPKVLVPNSAFFRPRTGGNRFGAPQARHRRSIPLSPRTIHQAQQYADRIWFEVKRNTR